MLVSASTADTNSAGLIRTDPYSTLAELLWFFSFRIMEKKTMLPIWALWLILVSQADTGYNVENRMYYLYVKISTWLDATLTGNLRSLRLGAPQEAQVTPTTGTLPSFWNNNISRYQTSQTPFLDKCSKDSVLCKSCYLKLNGTKKKLQNIHRFKI